MPLEGFDDIELEGDTPPQEELPKWGRGRPEALINYDAVERAAAIGCTKEEIAAVIGISRQTLYARMETDPEIEAAIDRGASRGKATLRRRQWKGTEEGNPTMLIWLGKQMLGQKDRQEMTGENGSPLIGGITVTFVRPKDVPNE